MSVKLSSHQHAKESGVNMKSTSFEKSIDGMLKYQISEMKESIAPKIVEEKKKRGRPRKKKE